VTHVLRWAENEDLDEDLNEEPVGRGVRV